MGGFLLYIIIACLVASNYVYLYYLSKYLAWHFNALQLHWTPKQVLSSPLPRPSE